jgi:hypothetical protein
MAARATLVATLSAEAIGSHRSDWSMFLLLLKSPSAVAGAGCVGANGSSREAEVRRMSSDPSSGLRRGSGVWARIADAFESRMRAMAGSRRAAHAERIRTFRKHLSPFCTKRGPTDASQARTSRAAVETMLLVLVGQTPSLPRNGLAAHEALSGGIGSMEGV